MKGRKPYSDERINKLIQDALKETGDTPTDEQYADIFEQTKGADIKFLSAVLVPQHVNHGVAVAIINKAIRPYNPPKGDGEWDRICKQREAAATANFRTK